jgi:hypothetical protein
MNIHFKREWVLIHFIISQIFNVKGSYFCLEKNTFHHFKNLNKILKFLKYDALLECVLILKSCKLQIMLKRYEKLKHFIIKEKKKKIKREFISVKNTVT